MGEAPMARSVSRPIRSLACLLCCVALAAGCGRLDPPEQSGELVVAIRADPVFYEEKAGGASGFEHDLAVEFAREIGARVRFVVARDHAELLERVRDGKAHFAAAVPVIGGDTEIRYTPPLREAWLLMAQHLDALPRHDFTDLDPQEKVAYVWAFHAEDVLLHGKAVAFIERIRRDGTLTRLGDRYYGHSNRIHPLDTLRFLEHVRTRLRNFRHEFQQAQEITGIDWRLLAALAYQESNWDPLATSPTNVRGMMMLTEDTADRLKVTNRLDAKQSIRAGAGYLASLRDELPDSVKEPDRTWMALAAYNLGMGHLNGARAIAGMVKRDPDIWYEMKHVLPLLSQPQYYERLKSGRGRGGEAVILVENVRTYHDILSRFEPAYAGLSFSRPPSQGRSATGTVTLPSAF
ncbi:MAG: transglycosylase SLT domain-containing protein [Rhodocyclaceae bacterium]|nr:transglycosylase SLT domain-containing protein [Rhodocyclaceae bacterium]